MQKTFGQVVAEDVFDKLDYIGYYGVYKNNRKATKALFNNYEEARQFVRKNLRKMISFRVKGQPWLFGGRNVTLGEYEIRRITK